MNCAGALWPRCASRSRAASWGRSLLSPSSRLLPRLTPICFYSLIAHDCPPRNTCFIQTASSICPGRLWWSFSQWNHQVGARGTPSLERGFDWTGRTKGKWRPGCGFFFLTFYLCLENSMDRGAWQATVHRVTKSWTWLKQLSTHTPIDQEETARSGQSRKSKRKK